MWRVGSSGARVERLPERAVQTWFLVGCTNEPCDFEQVFPSAGPELPCFANVPEVVTYGPGSSQSWFWALEEPFHGADPQSVVPRTWREDFRHQHTSEGTWHL